MFTKLCSVCQKSTKQCRCIKQRPVASTEYGYTWRKLSKLFLSYHPLCEDCLARGETRVATEVHHKVKHHLRPDLLYDWDNLQSSCKKCHAIRTAKGE